MSADNAHDKMVRLQEKLDHYPYGALTGQMPEPSFLDEAIEIYPGMYHVPLEVYEKYGAEFFDSINYCRLPTFPRGYA